MWRQKPSEGKARKLAKRVSCRIYWSKSLLLNFWNLVYVFLRTSMYLYHIWNDLITINNLVSVLVESTVTIDMTYLQVIACLDVRTNDNGDLVVTKGDQYDVREQTKENEVSSNIILLKYCTYYVVKTVCLLCKISCL